MVAVSLKLIWLGKVKKIAKKGDLFRVSDFQHAIPHIEFKAIFVLFKPRPIRTYIVCWGLHQCVTEKITGENLLF